jgi:uncharacterized protein (DUF433 family)
MRKAVSRLRDSIEINSAICGAVPVVKGTRFTVAQFFAQLADGDSVADVAENFGLNAQRLNELLHAFATYLDRPVY